MWRGQAERYRKLRGTMPESTQYRFSVESWFSTVVDAATAQKNTRVFRESSLRQAIQTNANLDYQEEKLLQILELPFDAQDAGESEAEYWCCWWSPRSKPRRGEKKVQLTGKVVTNANQLRQKRQLLRGLPKLSSM